MECCSSHGFQQPPEQGKAASMRRNSFDSGVANSGDETDEMSSVQKRWRDGVRLALHDKTLTRALCPPHGADEGPVGKRDST
eukprot:6183994-Pleurochrysis_carterae.AAC.2